MKTETGSVAVRIVSTSCCLPPREMLVEDVCKSEQVKLESATADGLGITRFRVFEGKWRSQLALAAAKECLKKASLKGSEIELVVDYSALPQDYVVPSWCMSNKIQAELGAAKAFNLGFGGGGTTNFLTAVKFAASLIKTAEVKNALLISADVALPGNRVINPDTPLTVLGDGGSAVILSRGRSGCEVMSVELWSDGRLNDVSFVEGGGLANPDRLDLYRLRVDTAMYSQDSSLDTLKAVTRRAAENAGVGMDELSTFITPNISANDRESFERVFGLTLDDPFGANRRQYGHMHGADFVVNLSQVASIRSEKRSRFVAVCSHGWGFSYGAMIVSM
ncbi:MAG: hypothetical protein P8182_00010 [Deltaproteobacteria bacterium]